MPDRLPDQTADGTSRRLTDRATDPITHPATHPATHPKGAAPEARPAAYGRGRRMLKAVGYGLLFAAPVTFLAFVVQQKVTPVLDIDEAAIAEATEVTRTNEVLRELLVMWQEATQPKWVYIAGTLVCLWIWRRHHLKTRALWAFVTMMVAWNLQLVLKEVVRRARPIVSDPIEQAPGYSFPSGHAANAAAAATILTLLVWPVLSERAKPWVTGAAVAFALITGLDRVFLGVHYPSDVTAGLLLGVGLGIASYVGYLGWNPASQDAPLPPEGTAGPEPHSLNPQPPEESDDDER
ncbi:phosphatase PAP2 family protein [Intrasporangium calvum]|uniref:Phosphoesterase PA-phosphatase related protein n=1 Tax=Intrasporangium calvum (strain ATCC 23552 / DSM 43043 / JCM 3097 / NBRC 12989 / NCIMB 10167 / NRRL B-3866 / 7 KIP) TaxID=710696 RepID=E6SFA6_INTC7|nr:phosphatase PAP2 family protein [Intrasporangium calvum]ADU49920.1 phosphoesterase PA-phosphatase related protein [Intrasporangium calvum DSM 43043]